MPVPSVHLDLSKVKVEPLFEEYVDFDTFAKSDFRVVKVEACEAVHKSKKLLKFILNDGTDRKRTILSGIHEYYEPEMLVGKTCVAITNLPTRMMMGVPSEGMLISAVYEYERTRGIEPFDAGRRDPGGCEAVLRQAKIELLYYKRKAYDKSTTNLSCLVGNNKRF